MVTTELKKAYFGRGCGMSIDKSETFFILKYFIDVGWNMHCFGEENQFWCNFCVVKKQSENKAFL